ncbi:MAG TPA: DUF2993 domain-containing protein [Methylomusa anaerophila]|uniref:DUF2993 domain-containing protein n=1 Tax=Methylomusa anaerophila TaxID=1930071 RepID=A0A348AKY1_9FIRM|nr:DUF2993 domain-containing protein [Methylomusa anaerophila]BBB91729.1 hypothetical protein MAMMFC1_02413 [Methylomusa anaerophila]HML88534.1 DUF2993 domain-containing protein [Methylomusa anaerophila]
MSKRWIIAILLVLFLAVIAEVMLSKIVSDAVAQGMTGLTGSRQVAAHVEKSPAFLMLGGRFDRVDIDAQDVKLDKIALADMHVLMTDVQLDMEALITRRALVIQGVRDIDLTTVVTQDELAKYLNSSVKGVKNANVAVSPGKVEVNSQLTLGGIARVDVKLEGRITGEQDKIKFVAERFWLNNSPVGNIGGALLTEVPLVDLSKLPFKVTVRDIVTEEGKVVIHTDNRSR